jgi:phosphohistidine phosphatase SixA
VQARPRLVAMPAQQIHLVRHGEVHNPDHVLYGRLEGFGLSELGHRMAASSAAMLQAQGAPVAAVVASPLQRTRESAAPWAAAFDLDVQVDERLIEPTNKYEGRRSDFTVAKQLAVPAEWPWIVNPLKPSWGEAYVSIAARMLAAVDEAWSSVVMLEREQRRRRGSWNRRAPVTLRCTIQIGSWWLTSTTSPESTLDQASSTAASMRAAMLT